MCGLIVSRFSFLLAAVFSFCDSGKQVSKTLGVKKKPARALSEQLTWRIVPNSTFGPILSLRACEFEGQYGVDMLVPSTTHSSKTVLVYRLLRFNAMMQV